jgi:hypothetical protein
VNARLRLRHDGDKGLRRKDPVKPKSVSQPNLLFYNIGLTKPDVLSAPTRDNGSMIDPTGALRFADASCVRNLAHERIMIGPSGDINLTITVTV